MLTLLIGAIAVSALGDLALNILGATPAQNKLEEKPGDDD